MKGKMKRRAAKEEEEEDAEKENENEKEELVSEDEDVLDVKSRWKREWKCRLTWFCFST